MIIYEFLVAYVIPIYPPQPLTNSPLVPPCVSSLATPTITKGIVVSTFILIRSSFLAVSFSMRLPFPLPLILHLLPPRLSNFYLTLFSRTRRRAAHHYIKRGKRSKVDRNTTPLGQKRKTNKDQALKPPFQHPSKVKPQGRGSLTGPTRPYLR
jgi:hypothetical protein